MTSGKTLETCRCVLAAVALALLAPRAWGFDLSELMSLLKQQRSGEARFTEQRFVKSLDAPLAASGTLAFTAPDQLSRHQLKPRDEAMQVVGNTVTLTRNGRSRSFALDATPEMLPLIEAMRGTLAGDLATLQRHFDTRLGGSAEQWTLELNPLDERVRALVSSVRIIGRASLLQTVETQLADGDRSVMTIDALP